MSTLPHVSICLFLGYLVLVSCKPTEVREKAGPCIGMDCLHGVLMHGDEEIGEKHNAEDSYIQLKEQLQTAEEKKTGPCLGMDCLHGVLMHGDEEIGHKEHDQDPIGPEKLEEEKQNPEDPEEYFHGVLMHGDEKTGENHEHGQKDEGVVEMERPQNPQDFEDYMHGVMMHNDSEPGKRHHDGPHEDEDANKDLGKMKPLSGDDLMHGQLMHGDEEGAAAHHGEKSNEEYADSHPKNVKVGPDPDDLHGILMHGDTEHGVDHSEQDQKLTDEAENSRGLSGATDPESLLHPEGYEHIDPKKIDLSRINNQDKEDFNEWQNQEKKSSEEEQRELEWDWKQTLGYITDGILSDIELMKRRYLAKFYTPAAKEEPSSIEKLEADWAKHTGSNADMRHELNLIGDTGPIGEDHHEHDED